MNLGLDRTIETKSKRTAPTGFRLEMARPERINAIVSQNGNAYEEGLGNAWAPIRRYWNEPTVENREAIRKVLSLEGMRREYASGMPNPEVIAPEGYTLDAALIARPGNIEIQLDLFLDYANNVKLYPTFHKYFRAWKPALLAIRGRHDPYFTPAGAEAFRCDNPNAIVHLLETGHFALASGRNRFRHGAVSRQVSPLFGMQLRTVSFGWDSPAVRRQSRQLQCGVDGHPCETATRSASPNPGPWAQKPISWSREHYLSPGPGFSLALITWFSL